MVCAKDIRQEQICGETLHNIKLEKTDYNKAHYEVATELSGDMQKTDLE